MNRCSGLVATGLFILACAAGAAAQSDVMCICTDANAASTCGGNVDAPASSQYTLYFCVLDPSEDRAQAWEVYLEIEGEENLILSYTILGEPGMNFGSGTEFIVGVSLNPPEPNSANLIPLMSMNAFILSEEPVRFFIRAIPGSTSFPDLPGYAPGVDVVRPCTPCGVAGRPSFTFNAAIEDEAKAWGEVKSLYDN